jgi:hypothetical protein
LAALGHQAARRTRGFERRSASVCDVRESAGFSTGRASGPPSPSALMR